MPDKFEKFTERARQALTLAQEEAHRFGHTYIGTEHLLLGLVRQRDSVAARVLSNMGVDLPKVRRATESIIGRGESMVVGEIGLTPRAKKVIELAVDEARRLNHHFIGSEHLLLGLVREGEGIAAGVLASLGVNLEQVRQQVIAATGATDPGPAGSPPSRTAPDVRDLLRNLIARLQGGAVEEPDDETRLLVGHLHVLLGQWLEQHRAGESD